MNDLLRPALLFACGVVCAAAPSIVRGDEASALHAIVFVGGAARADAETWLRRWEKPLNYRMIDEVMRSAKGFPKVVSSEEVPGLDPGYSVVLGYCTAEELDDRLKLLQAFYPAIRARTIAGAQVSACPKLENDPSLQSVRILESPGKRISVASVLFDRLAGAGAQTPDPARGRIKVIAGLFSDATGFLEYRVLSECANMPDQEYEPRCSVKLAGDRSKVVVHLDFSVASPGICVGGPHVLVTDTTVGFGPKDTLAVKVRTLKQVKDEETCGY